MNDVAITMLNILNTSIRDVLGSEQFYNAIKNI